MKKLIYAKLNILLVTLLLIIPVTGQATAPIRIHPANQHYFEFRGRPTIFLGLGGSVPSDLTFPITEPLDNMADHHINYGRIWHILPYAVRAIVDTGGDPSIIVYPWKRTGSETAHDGLPKFDLEQWDETYWDRIHQVYSYAQQLGIILEIHLFDECGLETGAWWYHPFHPYNNINNVFPPGIALDNGVPEFYDITNTDLIDIQRRYVDKMLAELSQYDNVIIEIANEYTGGLNINGGNDPAVVADRWTWEELWIDYTEYYTNFLTAVSGIKTTWGDPSPPELYTDQYYFDPNNNLDIVNYHFGSYALPPPEGNNRIDEIFGRDYEYNKPLNNDETFGNYDATQQRKSAWISFVNGGHIQNEADPMTEQDFDYYMQINDFANSVGFVTMTPNDNLVTLVPSGVNYHFTLVNPGNEYVIYLMGSRSSTGDIVIDLANANYNVRCLDPKTGVYITSLDDVVDGNCNDIMSGTLNTQITIPAFTEDLVLYLRSSLPVSHDYPSNGIVARNYDLVYDAVVGERYYVDRDFVVVTIPEKYDNLWWIKTGNEDQDTDENVSWLTFQALQNIRVYVALDTRSGTLPSWIDETWTDTGDSILVRVLNNNQISHKLYAKRFNTYAEVMLNGNGQTGDMQRNMYFVLIRPITRAIRAHPQTR